MRLWLLIVIICSSMVLPAFARPLIADLSLRQVEIDSGFTGTDILLFGARNDAGDIVIVIRGPERSYIVRKKERIGGIWMNRQQVQFNGVNGFYVVAANRDFKDLRNDLLLNSLEIGVDNIHLDPVLNSESVNLPEFTQAFLDYKQSVGLYSPEIKELSFIGDTLFRTIIHFPENIPRGDYTAEVYLFSGGQLSGLQSTPLIVSKKGFDAFMYDFAHRHAALYGILAIVLALFTGWLAGRIFRKV